MKRLKSNGEPDRTLWVSNRGADELVKFDVGPSGELAVNTRVRYPRTLAISLGLTMIFGLPVEIRASALF